MRIYIAGHSGMVGQALMRQLQNTPDTHIITRSSTELDLRDPAAVKAFFAEALPDQVILAAARVGGIAANARYPADFLYDNLMIQTNVIAEAHRAGVQRLLNLGSSCIYPKLATQPLRESALLTGPLEPTNEPYAVAKIAAIKLCESYNRQHGCDFRSVMPTNLYGPGDNFHPENSHVVPGLIRRCIEARDQGASEVVVWGSGSPLREFLHVDDLARACLFVMKLSRVRYQSATRPRQSHINVGSGEELTIASLARLIARASGFTGTIRFDTSQPDGTPRKRLDISRLSKLGWQPNIGLIDGLATTVEWYQKQQRRAA